MGLRQNMLTEPVSELELRQVVAVKPDTTVREAAARMREHHLGCVVIVDSNGKPLGKFTERKIVKLLVENPASIDEPVKKHMIPTVDPVRDTDSIAGMVSRMQVGNLRFLCVVNAPGKAIAISGQKGLMEYIADHFPRQVKVQRMKSKVYLDEKEGA